MKVRIVTKSRRVIVTKSQLLSVAAAALLAVTAALSLFLGPTQASRVEPYVLPGNPTCTDLGFALGFKVEPVNSGTYLIDGVNNVRVAVRGSSFSWTSTLGMDAVIVKGGTDSNIYAYDEELKSDSGLSAPINPSTGKPYGLSHIEFCYDYNVTVQKTASTTFTRTYGWTIDKSVSPSTLDMFKGDSGSVQYDVALTKDGGTDSDWAVSGTITVHNPAPMAATITAVSDEISDVGTVAVDCGVTFPYNLGPGANLVCSYQSALPDGTARVNTATVDTTGPVEGDSGTANISFGSPTTLVDDTVNVDDTNGSSWAFSASGTQTYNKTFACNAAEGTHNNTATIRETGDHDSASVTVNCYDLTVTKTANTSLTRTYTWSIDKTGSTSALTLALNQSFLVNYSVAVNTLTAVDSAWLISGEITVSNPAPMAATLTGVADVFNTTNLTVECPAWTVPANGSLVCTYSYSPGSAMNGTNTATATLQNTPSGTTNFSSTGVSVDFANATVSKVDDCIAVTDTYAGTIGNVCVGVDTLPNTITYPRTIGPYSDCGTSTVSNTATFTTDDTAATGSDSWAINVTVPCNRGCTLTIGYWKTHAGYNGNNQDMVTPLLPVWLGDANGTKSVFVESAPQAVAVLNMADDSSNGINKLMGQLLGAKLNIGAGASDGGISSVIDAADAFLAAHNSGDWQSLGRRDKNQVLSWATSLDNYNNGRLGPGHCSE